MMLKRAVLFLVLSLSFSFGLRVKSNRSAVENVSISDSTGAKQPDLASLFDQPVATTAYPKPKLKRGEKWAPHLKLSGEVDEDSRAKLEAELKQVNADGADMIVLEINTPGGSVFEGFGIARAIEQSKAPVQCVVDGEAASMGFYILQSCKTRMMTKRSLLMAHEPSVGGVHGQPDELLRWHQRLQKMSDAMAEQEAHRMKITVAEFRTHVAHGQEWWMSWDEANFVGAVDGTVESVEEVIEAFKHKLTPPFLH